MGETNPIAPIIQEVHMIWDHAKHNAFSDLIYYRNRWFCAFRESNEHEKGEIGTIRLIWSTDTLKWEHAAIFKIALMDLRDPKLSITPDGKLMLLFGAVELDKNHKYISRDSRVTFSEDGWEWGPVLSVLPKHEWLWRVTWVDGTAYGVSYRFSNFKNLKDEWLVTLWKSHDGVNYEVVTPWKIHGRPNECTLRVKPSGKMIALMRRNERGFRHSCIGTSEPPYEDWSWELSKVQLGGPNFVISEENEHLWASGRMIFMSPYGGIYKTVLASMSERSLRPVRVLPSDGDTGYPGMVLRDGELWISFHSYHQEKTAIFLAKIKT